MHGLLELQNRFRHSGSEVDTPEINQGPETLADLMASFSQRKRQSKGVSEHQWPASRLTHKEMAALRRLSNRVGRPVNELIRESVEVYIQLMENDSICVDAQQETQSIALKSRVDVASCQVMAENESDTNKTLEDIHTQLQLLNETLDGLQSDIQWALRNIVHHIAEQQQAPSQQLTTGSETEPAMLLLRDLIGAPELQQAEVCDSTRDMLQRILARITPASVPVPQERVKVAEDEGSEDPVLETREAHSVKTSHDKSKDGLLF